MLLGAGTVCAFHVGGGQQSSVSDPQGTPRWEFFIGDPPVGAAQQGTRGPIVQLADIEAHARAGGWAAERCTVCSLHSVLCTLCSLCAAAFQSVKSAAFGTQRAAGPGVRRSLCLPCCGTLPMPPEWFSVLPLHFAGEAVISEEAAELLGDACQLERLPGQAALLLRVNTPAQPLAEVRRRGAAAVAAAAAAASALPEAHRLGSAAAAAAAAASAAGPGPAGSGDGGPDGAASCHARARAAGEPGLLHCRPTAACRCLWKYHEMKRPMKARKRQASTVLWTGGSLPAYTGQAP